MTKFASLFNMFIFDKDAKVDISLWGYRETSIEPELVCALLLSFKLYFFFFKQKGVYLSTGSQWNQWWTTSNSPRRLRRSWWRTESKIVQVDGDDNNYDDDGGGEDEGDDDHYRGRKGGLMICHKEYADVRNRIYLENNWWRHPLQPCWKLWMINDCADLRVGLIMVNMTNSLQNHKIIIIIICWKLSFLL